ncbi:MAG: hypothetical protein VX498_07870 [Myxococcota bacterium]|nr:hypothetical protein [Myxococcota bacterium]
MSSERLLQALHGEGDCRPLAVAPVEKPRWVRSSLVLALSLSAVGALASFGFGSLTGGATIHGWGLGLLASLLLGLGLATPFESLSRWQRHRRVSWLPGLYLFEEGSLDARAPELRFRSIRGLLRLLVVRHDAAAGPGLGALELEFEGGYRESYPVPAGSQAERLGRRVLKLVAEAPDPRETDGHWTPPGRPLSLLLRRPRLTAWLVAVALGMGGWSLRDRLSDDAAFEVASVDASSGSYTRYLAIAGGRHAERVAQELLPLAALEEAMEERSVPALLAWQEDYLGRSGSVEASEALAALYREGREALAETPTAQQEARSSVATDRAALIRLLDLQEAAGSPAIAVYFDPAVTNLLTELDATLGGSFDGRPVAAVSPRYEGIPLERRRRYIVDALEEGFRLLMGPKLLHFRFGEGERPDTEPTVWVRSRVEPGTSVFEAEGEAELFIELTLGLSLELSVPGESSLGVALGLKSPDVFVAPEPVEADLPRQAGIYEAMLQRLVDGLSVGIAQELGGVPAPPLSD